MTDSDSSQKSVNGTWGSDLSCEAPFWHQHRKTTKKRTFHLLQVVRTNGFCQSHLHSMRQRLPNKTVYSQLPGNAYKFVKERLKDTHSNGVTKLWSPTAPQGVVRFERNFLRGHLLFDGQHDVVDGIDRNATVWNRVWRRHEKNAQVTKVIFRGLWVKNHSQQSKNNGTIGTGLVRIPRKWVDSIFPKIASRRKPLTKLANHAKMQSRY